MAVAATRRTAADGARPAVGTVHVTGVSFGSWAISGVPRPLALRPRLAMDLPLSGCGTPRSARVALKRHAAHVIGRARENLSAGRAAWTHVPARLVRSPPSVPRVLLVTQPTDGGVFRHVRDLAQGLPAHGFEPWCCGPPAPSSARSSARSPRAARPERAVAGATTRARSPRSAASCARLRPDLVHAHSSKAGAVARLARVLAAARARSSTRRTATRTPATSSAAAERRAYRLAERALTPLTSRVVCVCEAERRLAAGVGAGAPRARRPQRDRAVRPGPPVHPEVAALRERGLPVIATVSLLRPGKGIETLLDALPAVIDRAPRRAARDRGRRRGRRRASSARARARGVHDGGPLPRLRHRHRAEVLRRRRRLRLAVLGRVVPLRGAGGDGARAPDRRGHRGRRRRRGGRRRRAPACSSRRATPERSRGRSSGSSPSRPKPIGWEPRGRAGRRRRFTRERMLERPRRRLPRPAPCRASTVQRHGHACRTQRPCAHAQLAAP